MDPKISVVIPAYNGLPFIPKTVQCVLNQEYPAHEIIVIDDGSTDGTPEALREFGDRIIVKREANGGISSARNLGMSLVTGDWIAFLDHDDFWFKNKLRVQADFISRYPNVGFFSCNYAVRYPSTRHHLVNAYDALPNRKRLNFDAPLAGDPFRLLINENFIGCPSAVIVSKAVTDKVGPFDPAFTHAQDYDYWFQCAAVTDFLLVSEMLFIKKTHAKNISRDHVAILLDHKGILLKAAASFSDLVCGRGYAGKFRDAIGAACYELGNTYYNLGQKRSAFSSYLEGLMSSSSWTNLVKFAGVMLRKVVRIVSFDLLRGEKMRRI